MYRLLAILFFLLFTTFEPAVAQDKKIVQSDNSRSSTHTFFSWLRTLKRSKTEQLGSNLVLYPFPASWLVSGNDVATEVTHTLDSLNRLMHETFSSKSRETFVPDRFLLDLIFSQKLGETQYLDRFPDSTLFKVQWLRTEKAYDLYSIVASSEITCSDCDNSGHQSVEIWISVAMGQLTDKLVVAYEHGDDISKQMRYYDVDKKGKLLMKDFLIGELSAKLERSEQFYVDKNGKFKKLLQRGKNL